MPQLMGRTCFIGTVLLIITSCGDLSNQVHRPYGYGEIPHDETWIAVDSTYQSPSREMVYYDPKRIRREGDLVTLWQLRDYKMMQGGPPLGCS